MPTQLQLEGPALEPLLARVRAEHGSGARIVQAEKVRTGGVGGFFARAHFELTVELEDPQRDTPAAGRATSILDLADDVSAAERTATAVSTESTGFAAVLARLGATAGEPVVPQQRPPSGAEAAVPERAVVAGTRTARSAGALAAAGRSGGLPVPPDVHVQLARLGLPAHLQPRLTGGGLHPALVASLRALPRAPRTTNRPGSVLAVVGPLPLAEDVARQMARELDLPRSAVVLAGPAGPLRSPQEAGARRAAWSRRSRTTVVVVGTPLTAAAALQARALLEALEPASTWAVVEATRKPRDVGDWTRTVGRVDALALVSVDETSDPAAVLELGIPVGRLGARRATPATWAALLTDRVAA